MKEKILKNRDINNFLQKYEKNDLKTIILKSSKNRLLFLDKDKTKKDFYSFNDFDNVVTVLKQNKLKRFKFNKRTRWKIINNKINNKETDINEIKEEII